MLEYWKFQVDFFGGLPDFEVLALDNPGSGASSIPPFVISSSIGKMAEVTWMLIDHLCWNDVHLVGLSMGGMIGSYF